MSNPLLLNVKINKATPGGWINLYQWNIWVNDIDNDLPDHHFEQLLQLSIKRNWGKSAGRELVINRYHAVGLYPNQYVDSDWQFIMNKINSKSGDSDFCE